MPYLVPGHSDRRFERTLEVDRADLDVLRARKELHVAHDVANANEGITRIAQRLIERRKRASGRRHRLRLSADRITRRRGDARQRLGHELQVRHRDSQGVVDLVRHAGRQRAGRRHSLRDDKLLSHPSLLNTHRCLAHLPLDGDGQSGQVRLEHVVPRAGLHRGDRAGLPDGAGDENERKVFARRAQVGERGQTVVTGKRIVRQNDVPISRAKGRLKRGLRLNAYAVELVAAPR
jgi:hypothetical protein